MTNAQQKNNSRPVNGRFYTVEDCVLPPSGTRIVIDKTVTYMGREYYNPVLARFEGQEVMVFRFEQNIIGLCMGPELVCVAVAEGGHWSLTEEQLALPEGVNP